MHSKRQRSTKMAKYIYDMNYNIWRTLCMALDSDGDWKRLVGEFQDITPDEVKEYERDLLRPGGSPTDRVLTRLGQYCVQVIDLFWILDDLKLIRARDILKDVVPREAFEEASTVPVSRRDELQLNNSDSLTDELDDMPMPHQRKSGKRPVQSEHSESKGGGDCAEITNDSAVSRPSEENQGARGHNMPGGPDCHTCQPSSTSEHHNVAENRESHGLQNHADRGNSGIEKYEYQFLERITNNFASASLLGKGGFGEVYSGQVRGITVAVKLLKKKTPNDDRDSSSLGAEVAALSKYPHKNIIKLLGHSTDGVRLCLVYEYMFNGSLDDRLRRKGQTPTLAWQLRERILLESAEGLLFLHTTGDKPLIHGDIKSANILLDENFTPKISDFGLAVQATGGANTKKLTHKTNFSDTYFGSIGYLPEDLFGSGMRYNIKTDVYSFGIIIFECCTGMKALCEERGETTRKLKDYIEAYAVSDREKLKDSSVYDWKHDNWLTLMTLGSYCSEEKKNKRPFMEKVYERLGTLFQQHTKNNHDESIPSVISHHISPFTSGWADPSLQAPPSRYPHASSPQKSEDGSLYGSKPIDSKLSSSASEDIRTSHEYDKRKLSMMDEIVSSQRNIYSESVDLKNPHIDSHNGDALPVQLQKEYDARNTSSEVMVLKRDRQPNRPVEARENSDSDENGDIKFENAKVTPDRHDINPQPEHLYGNTRPEDHEVELLTHHAQTMQISRASPTEVLNSLPPNPHLYNKHWSSPIYQNVPKQNTEHMQNQDNECKYWNDLHGASYGGYLPRTAGGQACDLRTSPVTMSRDSKRAMTPEENSEPEDDAPSPSAGDGLEKMRSKNLPSFMIDAQSINDDSCSGVSSQFDLVKNSESGLYEFDNQSAGADYEDNYDIADDHGGSGDIFSNVLSDPSTPTHSPGIATPNSPPIYAQSGR